MQGENNDLHEFFLERLEGYRAKLLNLNLRNSLLNFNHTAKRTNYLRIIDTTPDLFLSGIKQSSVLLHALPYLDDVPEDEKTTAFKDAYDNATLTDTYYLKNLKDLEEEIPSLDDSDVEQKREEIDLKLLERVRRQLGLPTRRRAAYLSENEWARRNGINPNFDLLESPNGIAPNADVRVGQTKLFEEALQRTLKNIGQTARRSEQEMGVNTLYAAIGFIEWYESDSSEKKIQSPLLLHPISLSKVTKQSKIIFSISSLEQQTETNYSLVKRMEEFGIKMPEYNEEDYEGFEDYLRKVKEVIAGYPRWKLKRYITLTTFHFAQLVLYRDLDVQRNPAIAQHDIIKSLMIGGQSAGIDFAKTYDVDDKSISQTLRPLLYDADSSQLSAIKDVLDGKNLVIKGPPGTGKSQTITNIIAAVLAQGKTVLFVAEKMAALDVVKSRLDKAGLGVFCLALHSAKTTRSDVISSFKQRLEIGNRLPSPQNLDEKREELERLKLKLNKFASTINLNYGALGKSVHWLFWAVQVLGQQQSLPESLKFLQLSEAKKLSMLDIDRIEGELNLFKKRHDELKQHASSVEEHPWFGFVNANINTIKQNQLISAVNLLQDSFRLLKAQLRPSTNQALPEFLTVSDIETYISSYESLSDLPPDLDMNLLKALINESLEQATKEFIHNVKHYKEIRFKLSSNLVPITSRRIINAEKLKTLAAEAEEHKFEDLPIEAIDAQLQTINEVKNLVEMTIQASDKYLNLIHLGSDNRQNLLKHLETIGLILDETADAVLTMERQIPMDKQSKELLRNAIQEQAEIARYLQSKNVSYYDLEMLKTETINEAAEILKKAKGPLFLQGQEVRQALQLFERYTSVNSRAKKYAEKAASLRRFSSYLSRAHLFENNQPLAKLIGSNFKGFFTDMTYMEDLIIYANKVDDAFPLNTQFDLGIRAVFRNVTVEDRKAIKSVSQKLGRLKEELSNLALDESQSLDDLAKKLKQQSQLLEEIKETSATTGLNPSLEIAVLKEIPDQVTEIKALQGKLKNNGYLAEHLKSHFDGAGTDTENLELHLKWGKHLRHISEENWRMLQQENWRDISKQRDQKVHELNDVLKTVVSDWQNISKIIEIKETRIFNSSFRDAKIDYVSNKLEQCIVHSSSLESLVNLHISQTPLKDKAIIREMINYGLQLETISCHFRHAIYFNLLSSAIDEYEILGDFRGDDYEQLQKQFRNLDQEITELERKELISKLARKSITVGNSVGRPSTRTELSAIQHQASLTRPSSPIRKLLQQAPKASRQLKPCFLMSPLSVGTYLNANNEKFDLVIIDEASQMLPEDAISAIFRSKQLVVVGDPEQLPPTSFFKSTTVDDDEDNENEITEDSILELASTRYRPMRELLFHYRSRHESLIAFSNKEFYDDRLIVFPSPIRKSEYVGVRSFNTNGQYKTGTGLNILEAEHLIKEAIVFMETNPDKSLGIATVNKKQTDFLQQKIDQLYESNNLVVRVYIDTWQDDLESFFIKNLENVQGDERDAIFISTVYGPNENGQVYQRFGPINSVNGYRRLNVLFTRAKHHLRLFTSLKPIDIVPTPTSHRGVHVLKNYLEYAQTGRLHVGEALGEEPDSDFERFVLNRLRQAGYNATCQVGVAGYRIDLGLQHPNNPSTYILGIECDGASYHSSKSARDRDRIRQEILEGLGWDIYRIWSTDWFADPEKEFTKLKTYIEALLLQPRYQQLEAIRDEEVDDREALGL